MNNTNPQLAALEPEPREIYPTLGARVRAIFIDTVFILILIFICAGIFSFYPSAPGWLRGALLFAIFFIYEPFSTAFACTIGQYAMGIRARKFSDHSRHLNIFEAYVRFVVKGLLGWLSFLTIHSNKYKRAIHDTASGSIMLEVKSKSE